VTSNLADVGFVHLHVHTSFSLREGALTIARLAKLAVADRMPALAITDTNNLFGALEFSEKIAKEGIQPIVGMQLTVDFGDVAGGGGRPAAAAAARASLVLLAQSEAGYTNLMRIASRAYLDPDPGEGPHVSFDRLADGAGGLIALSGGPSGPLDRALLGGAPEQAAARVERLARLFPGRLYIELQRHGLAEEHHTELGLLDLAFARGLPLVATNEPFFATAADYEAHDALLCIAEGTLVSVAGRRQLSPEHRFKTRAEMLALFADLPEATANSVEIARRCSYRPLTRKPILPHFTVPGETVTDEGAELHRQAQEGLARRLATQGAAPGFSTDEYAARLAFELDIIVRMKFPGYFLIVADFIKWAKAQGIPVGPGRGSGAGSLVAYALTITDLDPIRFGLLFERFLNPERVSMPDFDIDFCQNRRDEVIRHVRERYGADRVAQIITFGSFLARGVMRNVGRVLEMPLGQVDKLAKLVPQNPANPVSLKQAIDSEPRLREAASDPRVRKMLAIAQTLEGLYSNASTHAAGIVIADRPLDELVPLYRDPKSDMPATQFNMKWVEPAGLVKFDFLGLKTLTVLSTTVALLARRGIGLDLSAIPLDDRKTYDMLGRGETVGVFQLESAGMKKALVEMHADRFEDLIALVALYRPGPMANIPVYCARKQGEEEVEYAHPKLEPILRETFGVITYQEQVQQIARDLAGYSLGQADLLRRAMGKKIKSEMDAQRDRFVTGAVDNGVARATADAIFDACAKFAEYGFNKSHSAPYALISYQTAYLKANHPVEFIAASMTLDKSNTDKLAEFRNEAQRLGISVEPPLVNRSGADFEVHADREGQLTIRYALSAVKGVGEGQAAAIVAARGATPFAGLGGFARRINPREVNKKALESLAAAGAFDDMEPDRARALAAVEGILAEANRSQEERLGGQAAMFGAADQPSFVAARTPPWPAAERLRREFEAIGFFLSGHPLDAYAGVLKRLRVERWADFARAVKQGASAGRLAATVLDRAERRTKSGAKMGIVTLSDPSGQYEAIVFQEGLNQYRDLLEKGAAVLVTLQANVEGEDVRARIVTVEALDQAANRVQKGLRIFLRDEAPLASIAQRLAGRGEGEVSLVLMLAGGGGEVEVKLPGKFQVTPQIAGALKAVPGIVAVEHV
jgi:DNA polymerase-3 subunit alpha